MNPTRIFYGKTDAMIAEVGAHDFNANGGNSNDRFCVMADGPMQFDTIPCHTLAEARDYANEWANNYGIEAVRI